MSLKKVWKNSLHVKILNCIIPIYLQFHDFGASLYLGKMTAPVFDNKFKQKYMNVRFVYKNSRHCVHRGQTPTLFTKPPFFILECSHSTLYSIKWSFDDFVLPKKKKKRAVLIIQESTIINFIMLRIPNGWCQDTLCVRRIRHMIIFSYI